jgi:glycosyltransferase involved in cell wall biosynthesis
MIADDARDVGQWLDDGAVVMASADNYQDFRMADLSQSPVVFVIEYTLATRLRILWVEDIATIKKVRSSVWTLLAEYRRRKAFRRSAGIQANGRPAFRAYGDEDAGDIMYFDTRMAHAEQIGSDQIAEKRRRILEEGPLRLAFSGRLERMKGAHHLVPIAAMLDSLGVEFHLDIFGDGALRVAIETELKEAGLENRVTVHGPIPFHEALVPLLKAEIDFFLCCHMQSDPSCTYLETLSCGVPIVGYANDAFKGVLELGPAGVAAPLGDWRGIANIIKQIDADRSTLAHMATEAASVGAANTFESTFQRRVSHLRMVADRCL